MPVNEQREIIALRTATVNLAKVLENFSETIVPEVKKEEVRKEKREEEAQEKMVSSWKTGTIKVFKWMGSLSKRFWQSDAMGHLKRGFSGFFSKISSTMAEILGPLHEFMVMAKDMVTGVVKYVGAMAKPLLGLIGKGKDPVVKAAQKTQDILSKMLKFMKGEEKRAAITRLKERLGLKMPKTKGDWLKLLLVMVGGALFALGAAIGGVAKAIVLPFQVLFKVLTKIPFVGKYIAKLAKIFGPISKWLGQAASKAGLLGKFVKGILRGFKFLGWPLMIILGLIDFIKGFVSTEGDLFAKIMGGLKSAWLGFFELPIKLIGWMADKVLGWFGISVEGGVGKRIMDIVSDGFDKLEYGYRLLFALIKDGMFKLIEGAKSFILGIIPKWLMKRLPKGFIEKLQPATGRVGAVQKVMEDQKIKELERQKLKAEQTTRRKQEENQEKIAEETKKLRKEQEKGRAEGAPGGASVAAASASARTPTKEIEPPDEIESIGIWLFNNGGAG